MVEIFVRDIPDKFNIEKTQLNITIVKELVNTLRVNGYLVIKQQKAVFEEEIFLKLWKIFEDLLNIFDPNYNRQEDFRTFFQYLLKAVVNNEKINFFALFCPGYTKHGYKDYVGETTRWKLKRLKDIKELLDKYSIETSIISYYSDAFLENTNDKLEPNWREQLAFNRRLFHLEGEKYFNKEEVRNVAELEIFSGPESVSGFIDKHEVDKVNPRTYYAFKKSNEKFYTKLGFTEEEMSIRNDRLITMYRILSNYLNAQQNMVFLPMENMYERENIFSENGTCTMYLWLKGE